MRLTVDFTLFNITFCLLIFCTACTQEDPPSYTVLQGQLPVGTEDGSISFKGERNKLPVAEDGTFLDTLTLTTAQYVDLALGDHYFWVYAAPGDEMVITIDSVPAFSGSNAEINDYLYKEAMADGASAKSFEEIYGQEETEFLHYQDSLKAAKLNHLMELPADAEAFQAFHRKGIEYDYLLTIARYPMYRRSLVEDYEPSGIITGVYQDVAVDNEEEAKRYGGYRMLVGRILDQRAEGLEDSTYSTLEARLAVLEDIQSPTILSDKLGEALHYFTADEDDMEGLRDRMLALATLPKTKEDILEHYEMVRLLKPGADSPSFNYENYAGGTTKLADLKGKYVYIDVWATWCSPCIGEIPHLKSVEQEFRSKNIEFVSISIDKQTSRDKWRAMIEDRQLGGVQLLANDDWNSKFIRDYGIRGIPRFILLDDQGKIVTADAERPSDPRLKQRLQALEL
ncbi:MAG: TlpA disulfide reductase family protein [Bacteroidota bacterium]